MEPFVLKLWEDWFARTYTHVRVLSFASFRSSEDTAYAVDQKRRLRRGRRDYLTAEGVNSLLEAIRHFSECFLSRFSCASVRVRVFCLYLCLLVFACESLYVSLIDRHMHAIAFSHILAQK